MKLTGGTPRALALIKKLNASGNLIDVYDRDRIESNQNNSLVDLDMMEAFDKKYGTEYHHHLLAIFIDESISTKELLSVYPDFGEVFNDESIKPNLIFINLATQQILSVTKKVGDVAESFIPHPSGIKDLSSFDRLMYVDKFMEKRNEEFRKLDFADVIDSLINALADISYANYNLVYREIDSGHIADMLSRGPNIHGLFTKEPWDGMSLVNYDVDDDDSEDQEGYTQLELNDALAQIESLSEDLDRGIDIFSKFFAKRPIDYDYFCSQD